MKSERRHELQQNELADRLTHTIEWCKTNGQLILGGLIGVAIIGIGIGYFTSLSRKGNQTRWNAYYEAQSKNDRDEIVKSLEEVSTDAKYKDSPTGNWALLSAANMLLDSGMGAVYSNPTKAKEDLDKAIVHYNVLLDPERKNSPSELIEREATFGLAQAYEGTNQFIEVRDEGEKDEPHFENAIKQYEKVAEWEDSAMANTSADRVSYLRDPSIQKWARWYVKEIKKIDQYRATPHTTPSQPRNPGSSGTSQPFSPDSGPTDDFSSPDTIPSSIEVPTTDTVDPKTAPENTDPAPADPPTGDPAPADPAPSDPPEGDTPAETDAADDSASENE